MSDQVQEQPEPNNAPPQAARRSLKRRDDASRGRRRTSFSDDEFQRDGDYRDRDRRIRRNEQDPRFFDGNSRQADDFDRRPRRGDFYEDNRRRRFDDPYDEDRDDGVAPRRRSVDPDPMDRVRPPAPTYPRRRPAVRPPESESEDSFRYCCQDFIYFLCCQTFAPNRSDPRYR